MAERTSGKEFISLEEFLLVADNRCYSVGKVEKRRKPLPDGMYFMIGDSYVMLLSGRVREKKQYQALY